MSNLTTRDARRSYRNLTAFRFLHVAVQSPYYEESPEIGDPCYYRIEAPEEWAVSEDTTWKFYYPPSVSLPPQGWKIHISARIGNDTLTLQKITILLFQLRVPFKHLVSQNKFARTNMKYSNRASSGKFITVYPCDDAQFCKLLEKFEVLLRDFEGPYILTDTQYAKGPVYFRYGGFSFKSRSNDDGSIAMAIQDPEGNLIEDVREPTFVVPSFVPIPRCIFEQVHDRLNPDVTELQEELSPYVIQSSLHFSNGGGVYLANRSSSHSLAVLKEARPFAGYTSDREDAISRLRHERDVLLQLQDIGAVPRYLDYRQLEGHEFLIESYVSGDSLQTWIASRYPFFLGTDAVKRYTVEAMEIANRIVAIVEEVHSHGVALMDISAKNFLIGSSLNTSLVDFEGCRRIEDSDTGVLGTPGFVPLVKCTNAERDQFGLVSVLFYIFWPSWTNALSPETLQKRLDNIACYYPSNVQAFLKGFLSRIDSCLLKSRNGFRLFNADAITHRELICRIAEGLFLSRSKTSCGKRLYPGDATQFLHGRLGALDIETGAAGVILMLSRAGHDAEVSRDAKWIVDHIDNHESLSFHGLLRGLVGISSVLSQTGFSKLALKLLPDKIPEIVPGDVSIRTGISGTALALSEIATSTGDPGAYRLLHAASKLLKESISKDVKPVSFGAETGNAVGLFDGWAGAALACHELSYCFDDSEWIELIDICLKREIEHLTSREDGTLYVDYSGVDFGYLDEGSAGIACALAICAPRQYSEILSKLHSGLTKLIALNSGLFRGLGGTVAALLAINEKEDGAIISLMMRIDLENYLFASARSDEGIFALGDGGACLSADYSTGSAGLVGILLSLEKNANCWFPVSLHQSFVQNR